MYLRNSRNLSPKDIPAVYSKTVELERTGELREEDCTIKNVRVSAKEVQMDAFVRESIVPNLQEKTARQVARAFEDQIGPLLQIVNLTLGLTSGLDEREIIDKAIVKFNEARYWEAQETAEAVWIKTTEPNEKNVVQGLILVGAALVHHQRDQDDVCLSMFRRALKKFESLDLIAEKRRSFLGIDIGYLRKKVESMVSKEKVEEILLRRLDSA